MNAVEKSFKIVVFSCTIVRNMNLQTCNGAIKPVSGYTSLPLISGTIAILLLGVINIVTMMMISTI